MHNLLTPSSEGSDCPACNSSKLVRIDTPSTVSDRGDPMAVVACPACNWREGWVRNNLSGEMMMLWSCRTPRLNTRPTLGSVRSSSPYERV